MSSSFTQNIVSPQLQGQRLGAKQANVVGTQANVAEIQGQVVTNVAETETIVDVHERRVAHDVNVFSSQPRAIVDTQKHLATEIPITTEKHVTTEYVPVTMEKIIQRIPVVVGQKVQTGVPMAGQTEIQALGTQYVQQQVQTEVDLIPKMQTRMGLTEVVQQEVVGGHQIITHAQPVGQQQVLQQGTLGTQQPVQTQAGFSQTYLATQMPTTQIPTTQTSTMYTQSQPMGAHFIQTHPNTGSFEIHTVSKEKMI
jgi:hypothetical protein